MNKMDKKLKFYNGSRARSYNAPMNFILSSRGYGKTYDYLKWLLKRAIYKDHQFCYTRTTADEADTAFPQLFNNHNQNDDCYGGLVWHSNGYLLWGEKKSSREKLETDDEDLKKVIHIGSVRVTVADEVIWDSVKIIACSFPIIRSGVAKGIGVPLCCNFLYDEFIPETGNFKRDVIQRFNSIRESLFRHRENFCRCFLLGNYATANNPWFDYYGIPYSSDKHFIKKKGVYLVENYYDEEFRAAKANMSFTRSLSKKDKAYITQNIPTIAPSSYVMKVEESKLMGGYVGLEYKGNEYTMRYTFNAHGKIDKAYVREALSKETRRPLNSFVSGGKYPYKKNTVANFKQMVHNQEIIFENSTVRAQIFEAIGINI